MTVCLPFTYFTNNSIMISNRVGMRQKNTKNGNYKSYNTEKKCTK